MFREIDVNTLDESIFRLIGHDWMVVSSGGSACEPVDSSGKRCGAMTASWGFGGFMWGAPALEVFVRPQRYTFGFMEKNNLFTCSFFGEEYRPALNFLGSKSGRDYDDKIAAAGLTPSELMRGRATSFVEAKLAFVCEKIYVRDLDESCFLDKTIVDKNYPAKDFHREYIGKIVAAYAK